MTTSYSVQIWDRDFSPRISLDALDIRPLRWSWRSRGGSHYAELAIDGNSDDLWDALSLLRCPIQIYADNNPVWWGFISDVGFSTGSVDVSLTLASLVNRVAVAYSLVEPDTSLVGVRATTPWVDDVLSRDTYGIRELLISMDGRTPTQAEAIRDRYLAQAKYPAPSIQARGVKNRVLSLGQYNRGEQALRGLGRIVCLGWWQTLGWRYYANALETAQTNTHQIQSIVEDVGEFFSAVDIPVAGDITSSEFRYGDSLAQTEIEDLLDVPTSSGQTFEATVSPDRILSVYTENPSSDDDWLLLPDGTIADRWGRPGLIGESRLGWAQLRGIIPASANLDYLSAPSPVFVDENEFDANEEVYRWKIRGVPSPWDIGRLLQG